MYECNVKQGLYRSCDDMAQNAISWWLWGRTPFAWWWWAVGQWPLGAAPRRHSHALLTPLHTVQSLLAYHKQDRDQYSVHAPIDSFALAMECDHDVKKYFGSKSSFISATRTHLPWTRSRIHAKMMDSVSGPLLQRSLIKAVENRRHDSSFYLAVYIVASYHHILNIRI